LLAPEEFITEAPLTGYQSHTILTSETQKPPKWEPYQGGSFYIQAGQNFGRMEIKMIPGNESLKIITWINPTQGSRNVEDDKSMRVLLPRIKELGLEKAIEEAKARSNSQSKSP
jgi:hypothetical protein